jgi:hypothetical protein
VPNLVQRQRAVLDGRLGSASRSAGQRPHARLEFGQRKRLRHVVVGTEVEAFDALLDAVCGREDQYGHCRVARAQPLQHFESGHPRQSHIEDQQVKRLRDERGVGGVAASDDVDGVTPGTQRARQAIRQHGVVFGNQDAHEGPVCLCPSRLERRTQSRAPQSPAARQRIASAAVDKPYWKYLQCQHC